MGKIRQFLRRKKKQEVEEQTRLGQIVDMDFELFKSEVEAQHVNIGVNNNLILMLESAYYDLRRRKEELMLRMFKGELPTEQVQPVINSIYAELTKLEQKIIWLKDRSRNLLQGVDTTS